MSCPWGDWRGKLDPSKISAEDRKWLADQIVNGRYTAAKLAKRYQLNRKNLTNWANNVKKGVSLRTKRGRSCAFDSISMKVLTEYVSANPDCTPNELKSVLVDEYDKSYRRKHISVVTTVKLPEATCRRYLNKLLQHHK